MMAAVIVTILLAVLFTFSSFIKLFGVRQSVEIRDHLGIAAGRWRMIGLVEFAGVIGVLTGLVWAPVGVAAAAALVLLAVGAVVFHVRASDTVADTAPAVVGVALAVTAVVLHVV